MSSTIHLLPQSRADSGGGSTCMVIRSKKGITQPWHKPVAQTARECSLFTAACVTVPTTSSRRNCSDQAAPAGLSPSSGWVSTWMHALTIQLCQSALGVDYLRSSSSSSRCASAACFTPGDKGNPAAHRKHADG